VSDLEQVGVMTEIQPWFRYPAGKAPASADPGKAKRRRKNKLARMARRRNRP
jgi:hypothetical protein